MPDVKTPPQNEEEVLPNPCGDESHGADSATAVQPGRLGRILEALNKVLDPGDFSRGNCFRN